ncbi:hypothetical protein [Synechococcus sp. LTW-G]
MITRDLDLTRGNVNCAAKGVNAQVQEVQYQLDKARENLNRIRKPREHVGALVYGEKHSISRPDISAMLLSIENGLVNAEEVNSASYCNWLNGTFYPLGQG